VNNITCLKLGLGHVQHFTDVCLGANNSIQFDQIFMDSSLITTKKLNSVAVVRKRTIPTERPPLVGEVSANLCR
jgi:hypothetical protein